MKTPLALAVVLAALVASGCASQKYVQEQMDAARKASDARLAEIQQQLDATRTDISALKRSDNAQNEKIAALSDTAKEALARAMEAGKLAKGKFLYEVKLTDDAVKFGFNKKDLSPEAKAALDAFAARLKSENGNVFVEIQGHTDGIGSDRYNLGLGKRRAVSALRYLHIQGGIPLHRMNVISYGKAKPVADNKTAEGRAQNRRIALVVLE